MAESKSDQFSFAIKRDSEKTAKFSPNSVNRLDRVSENGRERMAAETILAEQPDQDDRRRPVLLVEIADEGGRPNQ